MEIVQAWRAARDGRDLMQLSWAAAAVIHSAFGLRPGYWHDLTMTRFTREADMLVLTWEESEKTIPLRFGERPGERAPRVTAASHPVLDEVLALWWPLLRDWGSTWLCPVVQPVRISTAAPRGATRIAWREKDWFVWPATRRSNKWFGDMLRATATALEWPVPQLRQQHGLRGGRNIEGKYRGVPKEVRHAICWWSLRFMGAQLTYEPPTLGEMAASVRDHWATTNYTVVKGVPTPIGGAAAEARTGGAGRAAAAVAGQSPHRTTPRRGPPAEGRDTAGKGSGKRTRQPSPSSSEDSDGSLSSSDDDPTGAGDAPRGIAAPAGGDVEQAVGGLHAWASMVATAAAAAAAAAVTDDSTDAWG